ncbi:MAG: hypothetical protein LBD94_02475 [Rickettsiales bacterium]|nr:hypothetical protein [Rickettsiales bacterium]
MKKNNISHVSCLMFLGACLFLAACCRCEVEPVVEQNHKLIVPPNFGQKPKA